MFMGSLFAQTTNQGESYYEPLWTTGIYPGNASIVFQLYIDGELQTGTNWEVGAYDTDPDAGSLVCGFAQPLEDERISPYPYYMMVYSSDAGHVIKFKLYNHDDNQETDFVTPLEISYVADGELGNLDEFYVFNFYSQGQNMVFTGQGDWNDLENWQDVDRLPMALDNVTIAEGAICHMPESAIGQYATLTIEDGAELYPVEGAEVIATVKKNIAAYTLGEGNNWYLLSIPVNASNNGTPAEPYDYAAAGMLEGNYDFFLFDQDQELEWRNYKLDNNNFIAPYNGYLYANSAETTLSFTGTLYTAANARWSSIPFTGPTQTGVNLIGNPYPCKAEVVSGNKIDGLYMMNVDRNDVVIYDPDEEYDFTLIDPMTAMFAVANASGATARITLSPYDPSQHEDEEPGIIRGKSLNRMTIEVTANGVLKDRVFVKMGEGENCPKFSLSQNSTKLYVPMDGEKYAIAYTEDNTMPLCFTTSKKGVYTLNFNTKNLQCSYLHLIDNVTGADIDLLRTPNYTFDANDSNYATRFKLVFDETATNDIVDNFAFISNGELMINNSGEATLQVIDITGRILSTETIQNCYSKSLNLSAGVYVVRLSNGNDVKTQKIVVE